MEGLGMKNIGIFYDHFEYFTAICYILWQWGIFSPFWYVWTKNNLATLVATDHYFSSGSKKIDTSPQCALLIVGTVIHID
jgi:hypothetical protein